MSRPCWVFCLVLVAASVGFQAFGSQDAQFEEPERQALAYRAENVKRGYVRFRVIEKIGPQPTEALYETTFDNQRIAQKCLLRMLGKEKWGDPSFVILTPTEHFTAHAPQLIAQRRKPTLGLASARETYRVLDPRPLGFDLNGASGLHLARLDSVITLPSARTPAKLSKENRAGLDTVRLDYQTKFNGSAVKVWIAPSQGFGVVAAEEIDKKGQFTMAVESSFKQYDDVWYPERVVKTLTVNGYVSRQQIVEVEEARFSQPPDSAFSFESLGLEPGREVGDSTSGVPTLRVWDGKKLMNSDGVPMVVPGPATSQKMPRWVWILLAVVLALLAAGIGWRVVRSRWARLDQRG